MVKLAGGPPVPIRPIRPDDAPRLQRFHEHLSRQTIYYRFFGAKPHLGDALSHRFAEVDGVDRYAIIALDPDDQDEIVGMAHFDRGPGADEAELAIVVADRFHGSGLGRKLLDLVIDAARARGVRRICALVLAENARMIRLLRHLGYPFEETFEDRAERIWLDIAEGRSQPG